MNELADSITALVMATTARDLAYAKCDVDPDYFCSHEDERVTEAENRMARVLAAVIDDRVRSLLAIERGDGT